MSKFSVRKPFTVVVAVIVVLIMGGISFTRMSTDLLPAMELPYVVAFASYPGASPEEVEMAVTKPMEQALATTSNVSTISSISSENTAIVIMEFLQSTNMDSAIIEIDSALDLITGYFPDTVSSPMLIRMNPEMLPIMINTVNVDGMDLADVSRVVEETVVPHFEKLNGVASVSTSGLLQERLEVTLSQEKIDDLNDRVLRAIDSDLAEMEEKLDEAEQELLDGKAQLNSVGSQQSKKLEEGLSSATEGLEMMTPMVEEARAGYQQLDSALQSLEQQDRQLEAGIAEAHKAIAALEALGSRTQEQEQTLAGLRTALPIMQQQKADLQAALAETRAQHAQAKQGLAMLEDEYTKVVDGKAQLEAAREQLSAGLGSARQKINEGLTTLEEQREVFNEARDQAYEKASLDGVITKQMISGLLAAENFSMPAGYVATGDEDWLVKVGDKLASAQEMEGLLLMKLGLDGVDEVRLSDVADVVLLDNADDGYTRVNGNPAVMLTFQKQSTASTAEVCNDIIAASEKLAAQGIQVNTLMNQGDYIDMVIGSVFQNLIFGGILAVLILLVFLWDVRPTAIVAISIPFSLVFAVALMYFTGVTLNVISLAGLALGVGMLVDNSIVVIENIYRLRSQGYSAKEAAIQGAKRMTGAITASTLTTVCVFLPIVFVEGITRQIFADMGLTIAYSLLASLLVALTLVPTMASGMLRREANKPRKSFDRVQNAYARSLRWALSHKVWFIILAVVLLGASAFGTLRMGTAFIPDVDGKQITVSMTPLEENTRAENRAMADEAMEIILQYDDVEAVGVSESSGGGMMSMGGGSGGNSYELYLIMRDDKTMTNKQIQRQLQDALAHLNAEISISTSNMDISMLGGSGIEVNVRGDDLDTLKATAGDVAEMLRQTEGVVDVADSTGDSAQELRVAVDKEKAMEYGLTVAQVFSQLREALADSGTATTITIGGKEFPVIVMENADGGMRAADVAGFMLEGTATEDGEQVAKEVPLSTLAQLTPAQGFDSVRRENQMRYVTVTGAIDADHNIGLVSREFEKLLSEYQVPEGMRVEIGGENEMINNSLRDLVYMILLAVVIIYLIMVAQFQSLRSPFIVMFTIPLAFTGGLLALQICGMELSLIAMLGFLMLAGIVVNNGIVFVDSANQMREEGMAKREALVETGRIRLRPILMTAMTTILGLSTMALGLGDGAEMLQPMAVVTIGGLLYATLLTLYIVPALYDTFNRKEAVAKAEDPQIAEEVQDNA